MFTTKLEVKPFSQTPNYEQMRAEHQHSHGLHEQGDLKVVIRCSLASMREQSRRTGEADQSNSWGGAGQEIHGKLRRNQGSPPPMNFQTVQLGL
jgi:hypothetical protein